MITRDQLISIGFKPDKQGALVLLTEKYYIEPLYNSQLNDNELFQFRDPNEGYRFLFNMVIKSFDDFLRFYESIGGLSENRLT